MTLHIYSLTTRYTVPLFVYLEETRFARLDTFLKKNFFITRREYSQITGYWKKSTAWAQPYGRKGHS